MLQNKVKKCKGCRQTSRSRTAGIVIKAFVWEKRWVGGFLQHRNLSTGSYMIWLALPLSQMLAPQTQEYHDSDCYSKHRHKYPSESIMATSQTWYPIPKKQDNQKPETPKALGCHTIFSTLPCSPGSMPPHPVATKHATKSKRRLKPKEGGWYKQVMAITCKCIMLNERERENTSIHDVIGRYTQHWQMT